MSKVVQIINQLEMVGFIKINGSDCRFVSLVCETPVKLKVGCPHRGNVLKVARKTGLVNVNFNASVRRHVAEKFGLDFSDVNYENGEVWYKHVQTSEGKNLPLVVNKTKEDGKHYLQFFPRKSTHKYILADSREEIAESELAPYFYAQSERSSFKPAVISIDLGNVKELRASGVIMQANDIEEAEAILA